MAQRTLALANGNADGWQQHVRLVPYDQAYAPGFEDMQRRVPDIGRIGHAIGWTPEISLDETLRQVIDSFAKR